MSYRVSGKKLDDYAAENNTAVAKLNLVGLI